MNNWEIEVTSYGTGKVVFNGEDISETVRALKITMEAGKETWIEVEYLNGTGTVKAEERTT